MLQIPEFYPELVHLWWRRRQLAGLSVASRVCRAWTEPARANLFKSVGLAKVDRVEAALKGTIFEKFAVETLSIAGRGKKVSPAGLVEFDGGLIGRLSQIRRPKWVGPRLSKCSRGSKD